VGGCIRFLAGGNGGRARIVTIRLPEFIGRVRIEKEGSVIKWKAVSIEKRRCGWPTQAQWGLRPRRGQMHHGGKISNVSRREDHSRRATPVRGGEQNAVGKTGRAALKERF